MLKYQVNVSGDFFGELQQHEWRNDKTAVVLLHILLVIKLCLDHRLRLPDPSFVVWPFVRHLNTFFDVFLHR